MADAIDKPSGVCWTCGVDRDANPGVCECDVQLGQINVVMVGIGPDLHRVASIEVVTEGWRKRSRLRLESPCGMKMTLPGLLYRPSVGEVTCRHCLDEEPLEVAGVTS